MNGRQRILAHLAGKPVDCLPAMPITMTFAACGIGAPYLEYCTDHRVQVEGQVWVADTYDIDYVSAISDPAVESTDCGALTVSPMIRRPTMDRRRCWGTRHSSPTSSSLASSRMGVWQTAWP